ncbi:MAG: hypothetical protein F6K19_38700 [Cyanothece sp. SIO1E1]|nr:hypothetical protein [Cyanothece sp. SIO1E1]
MATLSPSTCRRLKQLPQFPGVWEGDRRCLAAGLANVIASDAHSKLQGDCILWVDGTNGVVRAIDMVPSETGHEAIVRALLRAIEYPHSSAEPARPKKIVVRDRQIQFFLRGALQNLDILIDYVPDLPLIDDIFRGLQQIAGNRIPQLPQLYAVSLHEQAEQIWQDAPWEYLDDQEIIAVKLNRWELETLYISVLGMMGVEYGILMYRSLKSLKQFRQRVMDAEQSPKHMQQAFLEQDCLFLTFDQVDDDVPEVGEYGEHTLQTVNWSDFSVSTLEPAFGSLHPLEGLRTTLGEEEAIATLVTLEALHRFLRQHAHKLGHDTFPTITSRYRIPNPEIDASPNQISVTVNTLPELTAEFSEVFEADPETDQDLVFSRLPILRDDFIPNDSLISLKILPWDQVEGLRGSKGKYHQASDHSFPTSGEGLPVILIQTSNPKAKNLIQAMQQAKGVKAICFNSGEDPFNGDNYDLGLFQTGDKEFQLFAEYLKADSSYIQLRQRWDQCCQKTKGYCGIVIAKGLKGKAKGNPQLQDMVALFETHFAAPETLGLEPLQLQFDVDWMELD